MASKTVLYLLWLLCLSPFAHAQDAPPPAPQATADKPLPDLATLMTAVQKHQERDETIEKTYIYRATTTTELLKKDGNNKALLNQVEEVYWNDGAQVHRVVERDGKPLTPDQQKKEDERIRKRAENHKKKAAEQNDEEIPLSRLLQLGSFTQPRRETVNGRPTIAVDFIGDPKAKTHNDNEKVIHELAGTLWLDEADHSIQHVEGRFLNDFRFYGGLVASIGKGTSFSFQKVRLNDEIWFRQQDDVSGHFRLLLLLAGNVHIHTAYSDFHKLKAKATILPGITPVEEEPLKP